MAKKEDRQTILSEYGTSQIGINAEAYTILRAVKNQLIKTNKKNFTFSDAIIELKNKVDGIKIIRFTKEETSQIKNILKGGRK